MEELGKKMGKTVSNYIFVLPLFNLQIFIGGPLGTLLDMRTTQINEIWSFPQRAWCVLEHVTPSPVTASQ